MDKQKIILISLIIVVCVVVVVVTTKLANKEEKKVSLPSTANQVIDGYKNLTVEEQEHIKEQYNEIMSDGLDFNDISKDVDIPQELRDNVYKPELMNPAQDFLGIE